ncbi:MAG: hypothetical protein K2X76_14350 [Sphingomonas sp.]|nr:hypothetical protein [Sphingomonas sp.]
MVNVVSSILPFQMLAKDRLAMLTDGALSTTRPVPGSTPLASDVWRAGGSADCAKASPVHSASDTALVSNAVRARVLDPKIFGIFLPLQQL